MPPATRITCPVLLLLFSFFAFPAFADQAEPHTRPGQNAMIAADKPYLDPDLESLLAVNDPKRYAFLARLSPDEQRKLYRIVKNRVDDEAGVTVSIMAVVSGFVPAFISARFADKMEPATVARISDKISVKKAIAIARHLEPSFMAEVAVYQDPHKVTAVVEGLPDKDLVEITRILFLRKSYRVVARFSDGLSVEKLKNVSEEINDPATLIAIARHMQNREKAVQTAVELSDEYLLGFMNLLSTDADYELAADVGAALDVERQINLINRLDPEIAAHLAGYYKPGILALIMGDTMGEAISSISEQKLLDICRVLIENRQHQVIAGFANAINVEKIKFVAKGINDPADMIEIARYMKCKKKIVDTATALSEDYLLDFMDLLSTDADYELAAAVGVALDVDRQVDLLNRLAPEAAARLAAHYPPETIARIMEKTDDRKLIDISRHLSPEAMARVSETLRPKAIDRLIRLVGKHQILAALPHMDLTTLKGAWPELTPRTRQTLKSISKDYEPLAQVINAIKP